MKTNRIPAQIEQLKIELHEVRKASLQATREGDYRKVAKLTAQAAELNRAIIDAQGLLAQAAY